MLKAQPKPDIPAPKPNKEINPELNIKTSKVYGVRAVTQSDSPSPNGEFTWIEPEDMVFSEMEYNVCETCGASNGRCGNTVSSNDRTECMNCYDTRKTGQVVVHSNLKRTDAELARTFAIIDPENFSILDPQRYNIVP